MLRSAPDVPRTYVSKAIALGGVALAVRALHTVALLRSPLGETLIQDARYYHETAVALLTAGPAGGASFMNVGYPYALALMGAVVAFAVVHQVWRKSS